MPVALPQPCLCLVTDRTLVAPGALTDRVVEAVEGGVNLVQLREKDLPGGELLELAQSLLDAIGGRAALIVNERVDVAAAVGAQGVQLGERALPINDARRLIGAGPLMGRSVHTVDGAKMAVGQGADFLLVGTMFATQSHPGERPAGPALMSQIALDCSTPLIGIGGITSANLAQVVRAGASGIAVIRSILTAPSPAAAARDLKESLSEAWNDRERQSDLLGNDPPAQNRGVAGTAS